MQDRFYLAVFIWDKQSQAPSRKFGLIENKELLRFEAG